MSDSITNTISQKRQKRPVEELMKDVKQFLDEVTPKPELSGDELTESAGDESAGDESEEET